MTFTAVMIGLPIGNFIYAKLNDHDWDEAFKISFFQVSAVAWTWLLATLQQHFT
jgi:hypothetical protein